MPCTVPLTVEQLQRDLSRSAFINSLGLEVIEADPSKQEVSMRMVMRPEFERYPDSGQWHGGPIAAAIDTARTPVADRKFSRRLPQASYQDLAYHRGSCAAQRQERGRGRCRRIQRWQQRGGARASHILDIACVTPHIRYWHKADMGECTAHVRYWG